MALSAVYGTERFLLCGEPVKAMDLYCWKCARKLTRGIWFWKVVEKSQFGFCFCFSEAWQAYRELGD